MWFLAYLVDLGMKVVKCHNNDTNAVPENSNHAHVIRKNSRLLRKKQSIDWIEQLLQTPLPGSTLLDVEILTYLAANIAPL